MQCSLCGEKVGRDEVGLTKKLINRGTQEYLCLACLSRRFRVSPEKLLEMADAFRAAGCTLFM
ncbi:MAG: DUF2197 domain-containing protein [Clostridia bacterium]|nr:DUF2197 domain-containing protein [Clostridia bacterium]MBR1683885.1 DUF2197 domain-containing protein [Clostridia bacterium]MBR2287830.1 DUF2197 domain-containing protein [Clostridia bacterium]